MSEQIRNEDLTAEAIPGPGARWGEIGAFALTFDGYAACGSFEACAEIANAHRHDSLSDLRTCLFFEQRRWRHFGSTPDRKAMAGIREIVEKIRIKVAAGDLA